jgi:ankyrin
MKAKKKLAGLVILFCFILFIVFSVRPDEARFIKAVEDGNIKVVERMLEKNHSLAQAKLDNKKGIITPALYIALSMGHNEIVKLLLANGASPKDNPRALRIAKDPEMAKLLIDNGADVNWKDGNNSALTALHFFASSGNAKVAELLINNGAEIDVKNGMGQTPLHQAALEGRLDTVKLLISKGADINVKSKENKTPFDYSVFPVWNTDVRRIEADRANRCKEVALYLLNYKPAYTISDLAWIGDMERIAEMTKNDPAVLNSHNGTESPLFDAIRGHNPEVVEYFLAHGAKLNVTGRFQQTPLQLAAYTGYTDIAKIILAHGAEVNAKGKWGETALHWAAVKGNTDIVLLLLEQGANLNSMTSGYTIDLNIGIGKDMNPIDCELRRFDMEQAIVAAEKANQSIQTAPPPKLAFTKNDTPLHAACYWNHIDIVKLLIEKGADVNPVNSWGITPLMYAVVCRYHDIAQKLLDNRADPEIKANNNVTSIEVARKVKDNELIKMMTEKKSN